MSFLRPCCLVMTASNDRLMKARMGTSHAFHLYRNLYPTHQAGLLSDLCVCMHHALAMQLFQLINQHIHVYKLTFTVFCEIAF